MQIKKIKLTKKQVLSSLWKIFLVVFGTFILAFGSGVFLVPFQIVSGGITGIGVLLSSFLPVDVTAYIFTWGLFVIGLIILGVKFSLTTLISTILYPVFLTIFLRTGLARNIVQLMLDSQNIQLLDEMWINGSIINIENLGINVGIILIAGIIGGACVGIGCSLTFIGGGSTGGLDILTFIYPVFWTEAPAKLVGWFQRVWTYGFAYGNHAAMKQLDKALFLVTMGGDLNELVRQEQLEAMKTVMLEDRINERAKEKEMIVFDRMSRDYPNREANFERFLKMAYQIGNNL